MGRVGQVLQPLGGIGPRHDQVHDAAAQVGERNGRAIGTVGAEIGDRESHVGLSPAQMRSVGVGMNKINEAPASVIVDISCKAWHDIIDAMGDPPEQVAVGMAINVIGGEVGAHRVRAFEAGSVSVSIGAVTSSAM